MQNLPRLSLYRAMDFYSNPYKTCRQMDFEGCASKCSWTAGPMDEKFTAILEYANTLMELIDMILLPFVDILLHLGDGESFYFYFYLKSLS